jgi:hypothetical protein
MRSVRVIDRLELASCGQLIHTDSTAVPVSKHHLEFPNYNGGNHIKTDALLTSYPGVIGVIRA